MKNTISMPTVFKQGFKALKLTGKIALVIGAMIAAFIISAMIAGVSGVSMSAEDSAKSESMLFVVSAITALLYSIIALRSKLHGWKLIALVFIIQAGIETILSQGEALLFNRAIGYTTAQFLPIFLSGLFRAALFAPLCVLILGKRKGLSSIQEKEEPKEKKVISKTSKPVLHRFIILSFSYVVVYFIFGYFVAWQWEAVRVFYTNKTEILPFFTHMAGVFTNDFYLIAIQLVRGIIWSALAFLLARSSKGNRIERSIIVGLTFSLLTTIYLLFPNPFMPAVVRLAHAVELSTSMFFFGCLSGAQFSEKK